MRGKPVNAAAAYPPRDALVLAVTGHRRLSASACAMLGKLLPGLITALRSEILALTQSKVRLVTANGLAAGADLIIAADIAAYFPEMHLWHSLPYGEATFRARLANGMDLTDAEEERMVRRYDLLAETACYRTVIASVPDETTLQAHPPRSYLALARQLASRADGLLAMWDGQPSAGPGGAGDVVAFAREASCPALIIGPIGDCRLLPEPGEAESESLVAQFAHRITSSYHARLTCARPRCGQSETGVRCA